MTGLLVITSLLLVMSGVLKVRSGMRIGLGVHLLTLAELVFAPVLVFAAAAGLGSMPVTAWMVPAGVLLVLGSSIVYGARMRAHRRQRERLEADRLDAYVKYFHKLDGPPDGGS